MFNNFCNLDYIALAVLAAVGVAFAIQQHNHKKRLKEVRVQHLSDKKIVVK